ncbi:MAG: hypothetical protein FJ265_05055 [Planctomycetes bacterium]|nr:hypothetical protein [Planctomycetota bacterium]
MRRFRSCSVILALLAAGCVGLDRPAPPAGFANLPWTDAPADRAVLVARLAFERGEPRRGLELAEAVLREQPHHVDALRLRQEVLRERGRRGLLWAECDPATSPHGEALAHYLRGRIAGTPGGKLTAFGRAAELAPDSLWPWLGLAHTLRRVDPDAAEDLYGRLAAASGRHPLVLAGHAALLQQTGRHGAALGVQSAMARDPRSRGAGELGRAQSLLALGREEEAWTALLAAVRLRGFDPAVQGLVHTWMQSGGGADRAAQVLDLLREDPALFADFARGDGVAVLAELLQRQGQDQTARALLARPEVSAGRPALRRLHRRLLLSAGDVAGFLAIVREDVPRAIVDVEPNQLRARWLRLLDGPWSAHDPLADAERSVALLEALLAAGFVAETEQVAEVALQLWPAAAALTALRDEARRQLAFEAAIRRLLYRGYQQGARQGLPQVLDEVRRAGQRIFGRDVVGAPPVFSVPLVGELVDPFGGDLAVHMDRYNRHLVLGRRGGGVAEGLLLTRLSVAELAADSGLPLAGRCLEVVTTDRDVRSLSGVVGGDLAGVALLNHFLIDYDAVREWARTIAVRRRIAAEDGMALLHDPLPPDPGMDPFDASFRLSVRSPVPDAGLAEAVLGTIRLHERQHLVDSFRYLPIEQNLWRGFALWLEFGMSASAIQAEMERRAELAALALSPHTELVLAHVADFLGEVDGESPHHRGFGDLARQLTGALLARGVPEAQALPSGWHLLDPALVRRAAQGLLDELP